MPESPWTTLITIHCGNPALRSFWSEIEDQLYMIAARCGFDTRLVGEKLAEVTTALDQIRAHTIDMRLPPHRRFKNASEA
jgi:hypothetical protein